VENGQTHAGLPGNNECLYIFFALKYSKVLGLVVLGPGEESLVVELPTSLRDIGDGHTTRAVHIVRPNESVSDSVLAKTPLDDVVYLPRLPQAESQSYFHTPA
jgi:hypothetical protein